MSGRGRGQDRDRSPVRESTRAIGKNMRERFAMATEQDKASLTGTWHLWKARQDAASASASSSSSSSRERSRSPARLSEASASASTDIAAVAEEKKENAKSKEHLFFSRSASEDARYLSNFQETPTAIRVTAQHCLDANVSEALAGSYKSVESVYQFAKYLFSDPKKAEDYRSTFAEASGFEAKKLGGKGGMARNGFALDKGVWESQKANDRVMLAAVVARSECDPRFAKLLQKAYRGDFVWLHFDRSGPRSYWGGYFDKRTGQWCGRNELGSLFHRVAAASAIVDTSH